MNHTHRFLAVPIATLLMCMSSAISVAAPLRAAMAFDDVEQTAEIPVESIQQFVQIYSIVKDTYLEEKNDQQLFEQAIQGLVSGLDKYSRYLSAEDYQQLIQYTEGDLASLDFDLRFDAKTDQWQIDGLSDRADSSKAGLKNGTAIVKVDDQELKKLNQSQVRQLLTGAVGSTVKLQTGIDSSPIVLVRNKKIDTDIQATWLKNQVLVLHIHVFQQNTANEIRRLVEEYRKLGVRAVLIDLRNNPGGLLSSAVESADLFLAQGMIVSTKSRSEGDQQFQALPGSELEQIKLGVLINARSASAAEVFTAALKDHGRAWVVGEKSYGKGVVQKLFPLEDGAALQMTVAQYYTPRGRLIEGVGILPNQIYALQQDMKEEQYLDHVAELILNRR
jgi:carboxyl-terminal processing protease